jgi:hypothetical protein
VDGVTWEVYGQDVEDNLRGLHRRLHTGNYRASPSRRAYIAKTDGRLRPLGGRQRLLLVITGTLLVRVVRFLGCRSGVE